ncbi:MULTISPECIES: UDP-glucose 4-epimerase GalE [unclassified Synechococcus]|uniref:UDP-glucose 4-epimerase GalE n=1 Tax=unclassified Synechococcus TaxID=2626047 RepID=UPI000069833D|nr:MULTISPECIES: UDP-glucose 4-epimerase GalE [unclassified Synechococcus]EAQ75902.1 UDP-glucose-4-epimerase [Synechococcus sp. WH 5701]MCP9824220.1 UDP-glucose 4-epimerase GalE [Synechococcus sp. EJ6-Ellesmere]WFN59462.1 UDP-glucose 4-epimerase GalE [Synechococcus sp. CCFWC 502]
MSQLLITGGAGFIGSHTCLVLLEAGHHLVVLDDFSNSSPEALRRVQELAGPVAAPRLQLIEGDLRSSGDLERAFAVAPIEAVVHFAGLKAVAESVADPLRYWDVNLSGSRALLAAMVQAGCRTIVFSSSATLYGSPESVPIAESARVAPVNPYGYSKAAVEQMLADVYASEPGWRVARLRYFNPVGAHPSGRIGEDPGGIPNNLFPFLSQVAVGRRPRLQVFGSDWPTADGTGVRDYIHVMDLADGHRAALEVLMAEPPQLLTLNLGSGRGHSVLELLAAFERACGSPVPYDLVPRRPGDVAATVADPSLAQRRLAWRTQRDLDAICRDGWAWQSANPKGYGPRGD